MSKKRTGFFLIELGIGILILIFMAFLILPRLTFMQKAHTSAELERLYTFCSYIQARAIATNKELTIVLDDSNHQIRFDASNLTLPSTVRFGTPPNTYGPPSQPTKLINRAITFVEQKIVFYPDGTISAGAFYLTNQDQSCLYALTVPIGYNSCLRKYRYDTSWIQLP